MLREKEKSKNTLEVNELNITKEQFEIVENAFKKFQKAFETKQPIFITTRDIYIIEFLSKQISHSENKRNKKEIADELRRLTKKSEKYMKKRKTVGITKMEEQASYHVSGKMSGIIFALGEEEIFSILKSF